MAEVLETALSFGDEAAGRIVLRGHDLAALAHTHRYEDVVALLWADMVPAIPSVAALGQARVATFARLTPLEPIVRGRSVPEAMRLLLATGDGTATGIELATVANAGLAAALAMRSASGEAWVAPDPARHHGADLLAMILGRSPDPRSARALERYMILMIDHGISASTYAARIAASTGADLGAVSLAALCVLEGASHGGAPSLVLDQLDAVAGPEEVAAYVAAARSSKRRIMGFGSRAYQGEDIRAAMMRREWEAIGGASGARSDAVAIEGAFVAALAGSVSGRALRTNVEYYAALLLEACGVPRQGFTPMFAAARAAGWVAHAAEQRKAGRMIRPISRYVGAPID